MTSIAWIRDVQRSAWGREPQGEAAAGRRRLHPVVFRLVFGAFLWIILAAFVGFAGGGASPLLIAVAALLLAVYTAAPAVLDRFRRYRDGKRKAGAVSDWAEATVQTQAGPLKGWQAMLQAAIGPVALAIAMTALVIVASIVS